MRDYNMFAIASLLLLVILSGCNRGIHDAPSGTGVYLEGELCMTNADDSISDEEYLRNLEFCWYQHTGKSLWGYNPPLHMIR